MIHALDSIIGMASQQDMVVINILDSICNMSSSCLMLISGWFGIKSSLEHFIHIEGMLLFWNVFALISNIASGTEIGRQALLACFLPLQAQKNWFITGYIVIFIFASYIEKMIEALPKKEFQKLLCLLLLIFSVLPTLFYFDITNTGGKGIAHLFVMYLLGRYMRKYINHQRFYDTKIIITVLGIIIVLTSVLNMGAEVINMRFWFCRDCSVFMILGAVCMLLLFSKFTFSNRLINYGTKNIVSVICGERIVGRLFLKNWDRLMLNYFQEGGARIGYYMAAILRCVAVILVCIVIEKLRTVLFKPSEDLVIILIKRFSTKKHIKKR